ncbi:hypothetical protein SAMN06269185_3283 [Natronoarchaeum philippinense]|uniref:Uncharacterized protein n=1 Tax=Natronoarchaeum philippinense TaxID=558529 RepID=A0A285PAE1_NATPI|nr:hypothetical protein [Natronoarchaeum philippinense]SNZ18183.1 hypothetical protein SAMN06269185_3283 [Natronoarchaeum philippinense]
MPQQLHTTGEEFERKRIEDYNAQSRGLPASADVGLYNDSTDQLADADDVGAITTEPAGAAYSRVSVDFASMAPEETSDPNWQLTLPDVAFDVSDSDQTVDSYFLVVTFTSETAGDSGDNPHLYYTGALKREENLSDIAGEYVMRDGGLEED